MRGKFQFFDAQCPVITRIESNAPIELRIEPKPAQGNMFQRLEQLGISFQQQILIPSPKDYEDLRVFELARCGRSGSLNLVRELKTAFAQQAIEAAAEFRGNGRMIQLSIDDKIRVGYGRHGAIPFLYYFRCHFFLPGPRGGLGGGGEVR